MMSHELQTTVEDKVKLLVESNRRVTFTSWVFGDDVNCNANKLAEAGFIFIGSSSEPDLIKCFFCNKQLDSWEPDDNPWHEHLKHSPTCPFAILGKPESTMTILEFVQLREKLIKHIVKEHFKKEKEEYNKIIDQILQMVKSLKD